MAVIVCPQCHEHNPEQARFCHACGKQLAAAPPLEERKVASVLFADLVGSTELAGAQDPERTRALLDRFYEAMAVEIEAAGGTVEKFIGDAVMAAFGAPAAHEDHAERALHAALAMRRRLEELFGDRLALRIGVNTGDVVVGRPREGSSFVTGDAVNVAARLEQAAAPGEIVVGERTVSAVRGAFEFAEPVVVEAKGKPAGVLCRRLLKALSLMRPRGVSGLQTAFVGRESELEQLEEAYRRVAERGQPQLVTVVGEAGVGKTTLLRQLWHWLAEESPQPLRRTGRCLPYGAGSTYWPLAEVLKEHFGIRENDAVDTVTARLGRHEFLGLTLGLDLAGDVHPLAARDRLQDAWVEFLEILVSDQPAVVLIEDLHWAEDDLFDLIESLLRQVQGPLLLVTTARPELLERRPGFGAARGDAVQLWLEPLGPEESAQMLASLLATELPASLRDIVVGRAEGNPFFVEELLASLIDQSILRRDNGGWSIAEVPAGFRVPDSVQGVVAARIDLLAPVEKAALQAASVIGRVFWAGPVYELLAGAEPDLTVLEDRDFIRRRSDSTMAGEREYAIKHALTREVAYESLPKAKRARLHAAFAAWLERVGEGRDEHASLLAHHYAEAVRPENVDLAWAGAEDEAEWLRASAVGWLRRAAELAIGRYEIDEALALLHRALPLTANRSDHAGLWRAIGLANALRFDGESFWTAMQEAISCSEDRQMLADLYSRLAFETAGRAGMWRRRPAKELVASWIENALELSEADSPDRARALVARAYWDPLLAEEAARTASELAEEIDDLELRSYAWDARRTVAWRAGDYDEARAFAEHRFELAARITDPDHRATIYESGISVAIAQGRFDDARRLAAAQREVASRLTPHHRVHALAFGLEIEERVGAWEKIRDLAPGAERTVDDNLTTPCVLNARVLLVCAVASTYIGDESEALRLEEKALGFGIEGYGALLGELRLRLALLRGDREAVGRFLAEPDTVSFGARAMRLDALAALGDRQRVEEEATPLLRPGTYLEPFALRALGVVRADWNLVERAAVQLESMGLPWHAAQTRQVIPVASR